MGALENITESKAAELGGDKKEEKIEEKEEKKTEGGDSGEVVVVVDSSDHQNHQRREMTATATATTATASTATVSRLHAQHPVPPIQVVSSPASASAYQPTPTPPQAVLASLNSRAYTNRLSLFLFLLHLAAAVTAVAFFVFKAIQGVLDPDSPKARREKRVLQFWLPPVEGAAALSIILAFAWQKAVRTWPSFMVAFILWSSFAFTMAAGVLLLCFSLPATAGIGVALIFFSIGTGLYACWVTRRVPFTARVFSRALLPAAKFEDLNGPAYLMVGLGFLWISVWCMGVIGALNFYYPALTIIALVLSLMWTAEVMRNVTNLTVSRVVALYYLRGMQSSTQFSFQRAVSRNLGSACLGSLFVPTIEALRILARGLNLLEGEDEFMFSCAHCCLHVMESVFRYGNSWAFVHGFRGGIAEHVGTVRGAKDGGAGGLGHHQLRLLPHRSLQRCPLHHLLCLLDLRHPQALHRHRLPPCLHRGLSHDEDRDGAAAGVRGVLLCVLRREPKLSAVRLHHPRPPQLHAHRPGVLGAHPSLPSAHFYCLRFSTAKEDCSLVRLVRSAASFPSKKKINEKGRNYIACTGYTAASAVDHLS